MSQIMYNYPAMLAHSADMAGYAGTLQSLGADIASEQAALQAGWQGDTGMSYPAWQAPWNHAMEQLVLAQRRSRQGHRAGRVEALGVDGRNRSAGRAEQRQGSPHGETGQAGVECARTDAVVHRGPARPSGQLPDTPAELFRIIAGVVQDV